MDGNRMVPNVKDGSHAPHYLEINQARLEHLQSLDLPISGKSVLEFGAGIGDLSEFLLERASFLTIVEGKKEDVAYLRKKYSGDLYSNLSVLQMDFNYPGKKSGIQRHQISFVYGVLSYLSDPLQFIRWLSSTTEEFAIIETCVSNNNKQLNPAKEKSSDLSSAISGQGYRPDRYFLYSELRKQFKYVYMPYTQPNLEQFPFCWDSKEQPKLTKSVYIASHVPLDNYQLANDFLDEHLPTSIVKNLPILELETINQCNAKCVFCISKDVVRKKELMPDDLFTLAANNIGEIDCEQLCLTPMLGDPLLDSDFVKRIKRLKKDSRAKQVRINTNLIALNRFSAEEIECMVESLDIIDISMAPNAKDYLELFGVNRFCLAVKNMGTLLDAYQKVKHNENSSAATINIVGRSISSNPAIDESLQSYLNTFNFRGWRSDYMDWGGNIDGHGKNISVIKTNRKNIPSRPCYFARCPHIWADGTVSLCACAGVEKTTLKIGDLNEKSLKDILMAPERLSMIFSFLKGKAPAYCNHCSFYRKDHSFDWGKFYSCEKIFYPRPRNISLFSFSRKSHWDVLEKYSKFLYRKEINKNNCNLKTYQDLLVYSFIVNNIPKGSSVLEVGGGNSRILQNLSKRYDCWNLDKFEGIGNGPKRMLEVPYKVVNAYAGEFSSELKDNFFDFVFSISALEHVEPDNNGINVSVMNDINRVLKPGGYSLHTFDAIINGGMGKDYYDFIYYYLSLSDSNKHDLHKQFTPLGANRPHNGVVYFPSIISCFLKCSEETEVLSSNINISEIQDSLDVWWMGEKAYERCWKNITKFNYGQVGCPISINVLWRKKK